MGCIRLPYLEIFFLVIWTCSSSALPVLQKEEGETVHLSYSCAHLHNDERTHRLPPVFMIHGVTDNRHTWDGIDDVIITRTGRRVCRVDVRNHGDSTWSDLSRVDAMADDIIELMKNMKIEKAALIGHSMGGLITINIAQKQPEKTERVVVEDMVTHIAQGVLDVVANFVVVLMQSIVDIPVDSTKTEAQDMIVDYLKKNRVEGFDVSGFKRPYFAISCRNGTWQWNAYLKAIHESLKSPEAFVGKIESNPYQGEALFIYGTTSALKVFENKDDILQSFPKAEFVGVEGAGHYIHPYYRQFLTEVLKFLERAALPTKQANLPWKTY